MYFRLVRTEVLSYCHIIITSRHVAGRKIRRYCDTLWEIVGFTRSDAESFILKSFKGKECLAAKLLQELRSDRPEHRDTSELTTNPLSTALFCILCDDNNGDLPNNKTQLYIKIVSCVLRRKYGLSSIGDPITVYREELIELGRMAFESLRKGKSYFEHDENRSLVLTKFSFLSIRTGGPILRPGLRYGFLQKSLQEFLAGFYLASLID